MRLSAFAQYSVNYNIWSVRSTPQGWEPTDLSFPGIRLRRQFHPPLLGVAGGFNLVRYGRMVYAIPHDMDRVDITDDAVRDHLQSAETLEKLKSGLR